MRRVHLLVAGVLTLAAAAAAMAAERPATRPSLLHDLLQADAPTRDWRVHLGLLPEDADDDPRGAELAFPPPPAPDADEAVVAAWWWSVVMEMRHPAYEMPLEHQLKIVSYGRKHPDALMMLISPLKPDPATADALKQFLDENPAPAVPEEDRDRQWQTHVTHWLMHNSRYFRDELHIRSVDLGPGDTDQARRAFTALAKLDLSTARHLSAGLLKSEVLTTPSFVRATLFKREIQPDGDRRLALEHRDALLAICADGEAVQLAREEAAETLTEIPWPDDRAAQDRWVLEALVNPNFIEVGSQSSISQTIVDAMCSDPGHWIDLLLPQIGSPDRKQHDVAVATIAELLRPISYFSKPQKRWLRPLLPWLKDAGWAAGDRATVVRLIAEQDMPESADGLLSVVQQANGGGESARQLAADVAKALARYKPPGTVDALKNAFAGQEGQNIDALTEALALCDGFGRVRVLEAIESYARWLAMRDAAERATGRFVEHDEMAKFKSADLGQVLTYASFDEPGQPVGLSEDIARRIVARADQLRAKEPDVARQMRAVLAGWTTRAAVKAMVRWALVDDATAGDVAAAGRAAGMLRKSAHAELQAAATGRGRPAGIAAALLADRDLCQKILTAGDDEAAAYLLATARQSRTPLDVPAIVRRLAAADAGNDDIETGELIRAAEMYLICVDTPASRQIVYDRHPGEVLILGTGSSDFPGEAEVMGTFPPDPKPAFTLTDWDIDPLRREFLGEDAQVVEMFALLSGGGFGDDGQRVVRVLKDGSATLTIETHPRRIRQRPLTADELATLRQRMSDLKADELPPLWQMVFDGVWYDYVQITPAGGRQLYINNPSLASGTGTPYDLLVRHFQVLEEATTTAYEVRYAAEMLVPGWRVIATLPEEEDRLLSVWRSGKDLRVLRASDKAWHSLSGSKIGQESEVPPGRSTYQPPADNAGFRIHPLNADAPRLVDGSTVHVATAPDDWRRHLWKFASGEKPFALTDDEAQYASPMVLAGASTIWAVRDPSKGDKAIVAIDSATKKQRKVELPAGAFLSLKGFIPAQGKILASVVDKAGGERHYLIDLATLVAAEAEGDFRPLQDMPHWSPQRSSRPGEWWVVVPKKEAGDVQAGSTEIGLYDTRTFRFTPLLTIPDISLNSDNVWVDEAAREVLIAVDRDIMIVPLPAVAERRS